MAAPRAAIAPADVARFRRDGALHPLRALAAAEAGEHLARYTAMRASRGGRLSVLINAKPHLLVPALWALVQDPRVVDAVTALLGDDIACFGTSFITKAPASGAHVAWHQDATYWGLTAPRAVTAWIALTPSTEAAGCVRYIPGSHRTQLAHEDSGDVTNLLGARERIAGAVDPAASIAMPLEPGEMSLHHVLVVHASEPNRATHERVGFAIRYLPGDVYQRGGSATPVRGRFDGRWMRELQPLSEFDPDAMARHPDIVRRAARIIASEKLASLRANGADERDSREEEPQ